MTALLLTLAAMPARAAPCPDFYRFVDFGAEGRDGILRRGGTIFRAFDAAGQSLLLADRTRCEAVPENAVDGRALQIPVVSQIAIDPGVALLDVAELQLATSSDPAAEAEANAAKHLARLASADATQYRGPDFLCAAAALPDDVSCQLVPPSGGSAPLVVYCDAAQCRMPVLVRDDGLVAQAAWPRRTADPALLGAEIGVQISQIHAFLARQS